MYKSITENLNIIAMPEKKLDTTGKLSPKEINVTKNKENTEIVETVYLKKPGK